MLTQWDAVFTNSFVLLTRWQGGFYLCKRHINYENGRMHKTEVMMGEKYSVYHML